MYFRYYQIWYSWYSSSDMLLFWIDYCNAIKRSVALISLHWQSLRGLWCKSQNLHFKIGSINKIGLTHIFLEVNFLFLTKFQNQNRKTSCLYELTDLNHGLWTPGEEIAFTARLKNKSQSQSFRYCQSIFCLLIGPKFQISLIHSFIRCL